MTRGLLLVDWNDVVDSLNRLSVAINPVFIGRALLRQVGLRCQIEQAHVIGDWSGPEGLSASGTLQRLGFTLHPSPRGGTTTAGGVISTLMRAAAVEEIVCVCSDAAFAAALAGVDLQGRRLCLWHTQRDEQTIVIPEGIEVCSLAKALHLQTAATVGLFVDWEHVQSGLRDLNVRMEPDRLAEGLIRCAGLLGEVTTARVYGVRPTHSEPTAGRMPDRARDAFTRHFELMEPSAGSEEAATYRLAADALAMIDTRDAPDIWILVADDEALLPLMNALHERRKRAVLWAVDSPTLPLAVKTACDHFVPLQWVLDLRPPHSGSFLSTTRTSRAVSPNRATSWTRRRWRAAWRSAPAPSAR